MSAFTTKKIEYRGLGQRFDGSGRRPVIKAWAVINLEGKPMSALTFEFGNRRTEAQAKAMAEERAAELNQARAA